MEYSYVESLGYFEDSRGILKILIEIRKWILKDSHEDYLRTLDESYEDSKETLKISMGILLIPWRFLWEFC